MSRVLHPVQWLPRELPLEPLAVVAHGAAAVRLGRRMLTRDDTALARWLGVVGRDLLLLLGEGSELPWVDGVVYLGRDPAAPALLLPTTLQPSVSAALLQQAVSQQKLVPPIAVLPQSGQWVGAGLARPVVRSELLRWLEKRS